MTCAIADDVFWK